VGDVAARGRRRNSNFAPHRPCGTSQHSCAGLLSDRQSGTLGGGCLGASVIIGGAAEELALERLMAAARKELEEGVRRGAVALDDRDFKFQGSCMRPRQGASSAELALFPVDPGPARPAFKVAASGPREDPPGKRLTSHWSWCG
jgi:hypothetical protein